ncbi:MAG: excisionase [Janthinobacterium lividum]
MNSPAINIQYVLIPVFCALTGYSEKAVRRKIQDGIWLNGKEYKKAPDGHITMNLEGYYKWVDGA